MIAAVTVAEAAMDARAEKLGLDPRTCHCYSTSDNNGVIHPVLCQAHRDEHHHLLADLWRSPPKYARYFASDQDANDRAGIIYRQWPAEGYSTIVNVIPVSRWWLVVGRWADSAD